MKRFFREEGGNILIFSVIVMVTTLLFASMAIDVGCLLTAKNQLQAAADAAALAGATGLIVNNSEAVSRAVNVAGSNDCINQSVLIGSDNVGFPATNQVSVQTSQIVNLFFSRVVGLNSAPVSAVAVAELGTIVGTKGMRPWGIPDLGWTKGSYAVLKAGSLRSPNAPARNPSYYYCIDFPPLNKGTPNTGASAYRYNIAYGSQSEVGIGDIIQVEPGNMPGPTAQGINELIATDPGAYWNGQELVGSAYPGTSSPRVVKIPFYDPSDPPNSGRNTINVIGLGSFLLLGVHGDDVVGVFVEKMTSGTFGNGNSLLKGTKLVL
jgi:hypothetical protein